MNLSTMIVNTLGQRTTGDLMIKKQITDNDEDRSTVFTFKIKLVDKDNNPITNKSFTASGLLNNQSSVYFVNDGFATVKIKADHQVTITGLPDGAKYSISEDTESSASENYQFKEFRITNAEGTITSSENLAEGNIEARKMPVITAVNETKKAGLGLHKTVIGTSNKDVVFEFDLYLWKEKYDKDGKKVYEDLGIGEKRFKITTGGELKFIGGKESEYTDPETNKKHAASKSKEKIKLKNGDSIFIEGIEKGVHFAFVETKLPAGYSFGDEFLNGVLYGTVEGAS